MSKILVTGGAGFVGSHLTDKLIEEGHSVVVIDNLISGKKEYINPKAKFYKDDICSDKIAEIFNKENPDYAFHLAAQIDIGKSIEDPHFDNQVNALGSLNIFKAAAEAKAKKIIFVSTGGALYGDCLTPAAEDTLIQPGSPYAIHKYTAERYLEMIKDLYGIKYAIVRPANIYGPRQYKGGECGVIGIYINNHHFNLPSVLYGDGTKTRDYVHVNDVVKALMATKKPDITGIFNISSSIETNNLEIIKIIEKISEREFDFKFVNDKPGEVRRSCLNFKRAKDKLGWEGEVDLETGINSVFNWLKNN